MPKINLFSFEERYFIALFALALAYINDKDRGPAITPSPSGDFWKPCY